MLKQIPEYADFNPAKEVLWCKKPGTGSVDAPRGFHLKLAKVTRGECNLVPTKTDGELLTLRTGGELKAILAIHVDDLKFAGDKDTIQWIVDKLQSVFGNLIVQWHNFTNCGIRHTQDPTTMEITLDQFAYVAAIKNIQHPAIKGAKLDDIVPMDLFEQFRSSRGAVAYALLTRADVSVYVVYLQRQSEKTTTFKHIKMLSIVINRIRTDPVSLTYKYLGKETYFLVFSDAAFKKEESTGHALKGTLICRVSTTANLDRSRMEPGQKSEPVRVHLIDFMTKRVSNVTRSTFSAELFSVCDAGDYAILLRQIVHEFTVGPLGTTDARSMTEGVVRSPVRIELLVDAMSVFAAVTASNIKVPREKSLLGHLQYLREKIDRRVFEALIWCDTRDMAADGLTKGSIDRSQIVDIMNGSLLMQCNTQTSAGHRY